QGFGAIEVDRPTHAENAVAEETVGLRIPVGVTDPLPRRGPEVVGNEPEDPALPRSLGRRLRQLGRNGGDHKAKCQKPYEATHSAQTPHTSVKRSTRVTLHVFHTLLQAR